MKLTQKRESNGANDTRSVLSYRLASLWPFAVWTLVCLVTMYALSQDGSSRVYMGYMKCDTSAIAAVEGGRLERIAVAVGDQVAPTTLVAQLDDSLEIAAIESAVSRAGQDLEERRLRYLLERQSLELERDEWNSRLAENEAELAVQEEELERLESLVSRNLVDRSLYTRARAKVATLLVETEKIPEIVARLEASIQELGAFFEESRSGDNIAAQSYSASQLVHVKRARMSIRASSNGTVSEVLRRAGEVVDAGEPIVTLVHRETAKIVGYLPPEDVGSLALGQIVEISTQRRLADPLVGRIASLSPGMMELGKSFASSGNPLSGSFWFTVELDDASSINLGEPVAIKRVPENGLSFWNWLGRSGAN